MNEKIGLTEQEVQKRQLEYGKNQLLKVKKETIFHKLFHVLEEPMFLLLLASSIIYFLLKENRDGIIMLVFVGAMITIDLIQEWKTDRTLNALKDLSAPKITVIRDAKKQEILSENLVPGDIMLIHEGVKIPADGKVIQCSGLRVEESSLTGESEAVFKQNYQEDKDDDYWKKNICYAGTLVIGGSGIVEVEHIGTNTEYGKIGLHLANTPKMKTTLQKQTRSLVRICAWIAFILFISVFVLTFLRSAQLPLHERLIESILSGITLAMAMIPEEFPVVLTVFLSMGAWRLAKKHALVKTLPAVETLGAVSVLCVDKTGTLTTNQMTVLDVWCFRQEEADVIEMMGLCCAEQTYDPMEKAMLSYCEENKIPSSHLFSGTILKEFPFSDQTKMMGRIWNHEEQVLLGAKGSYENTIRICRLSTEEKDIIHAQVEKMSKEGLRVIAVAKKVNVSEPFFEQLSDYQLEFCGLIGLLDPPRESIKMDLVHCQKAGIRVIMITGDHGLTAKAIAKKIGLSGNHNVITGEMIDSLSDEQLKEKVKETNIFARVVPEHKMKIIKALQANGETVAMTGDGVNDAPALKAADIGIALGKRGSEVSREAADFILLDDRFSTIVDTIKDGRRIYDNIRKSVGYIFTIHIPIALASLFGPILGIEVANLLFLPIHVVIMELMIDPTCSIVLERNPAELDIMERPPRRRDDSLVTGALLCRSILQGLFVFLASFGTYYFMAKTVSFEIGRTMGIVIILLSNLFLVDVMASDKDSIIKSLKHLRHDKVIWLIHGLTLFMVILLSYFPINHFLKLVPLSINQIFICFGIAFCAVFWYEGFKWYKRKRKKVIA